MRIDNRDLKNIPTPPQRATRVRPSGEIARPSGYDGGSDSDHIELDDRRWVVEEALTADAAAREAKIQRLSQDVRAGTYEVNAEELSRTIVNDMIAEGGSGSTSNP
ncbi:MAG: flagellar biosynthesis anti-sigma factor FlgM [Acidobacteria bacterium]|nr:flagellar biosynthesis anti-sigma factor FlgM [Acidobacteriota bacterium]